MYCQITFPSVKTSVATDITKAGHAYKGNRKYITHTFIYIYFLVCTSFISKSYWQVLFVALPFTFDAISTVQEALDWWRYSLKRIFTLPQRNLILCLHCNQTSQFIWSACYRWFKNVLPNDQNTYYKVWTFSDFLKYIEIRTTWPTIRRHMHLKCISIKREKNVWI